MTRERRFASSSAPRALRLATLALVVDATACAAPSVPMAPTPSPRFAPVAANLQLGGTVYAFVDLEGDAERATAFVLSLAEGAGRPSSLEATKLAKALGLTTVDAIGLSSFDAGALYHNRAFVHLSGQRGGVLRLFGTDPRPLRMPGLAPETADLVWEQQLDLPSVVAAARDLGRQGLGPSPEEIDRALAKNLPGLDVTLGELVERLDTTRGLVVDIDEQRVLRVPGESFRFPFTQFLLEADGLEDIVAAIERRAFFDPFIQAERTDEWLVIGTSIRLPPPWNAYQPSLIQELATGRVYFVSSPAFLDACRKSSAKVTEASDYQAAFESLPTEANAMLYLSPTLTRELHGLVDRWMNAAGASRGATIARTLLPDAGSAVGWIAENRPDGILFASNSPSSHKSTLLTLSFAALLPVLVAMAPRAADAPPPPQAFPPVD